MKICQQPTDGSEAIPRNDHQLSAEVQMLQFVQFAKPPSTWYAIVESVVLPVWSNKIRLTTVLADPRYGKGARCIFLSIDYYAKIVQNRAFRSLTGGIKGLRQICRFVF